MGSQGTPTCAVNGSTRGSNRQPIVTSTNELLKDDTQRTVFPVISLENENMTLALKVWSLGVSKSWPSVVCWLRLGVLGMVARRLAGRTVTVHFLGIEYAV